MQENNRTAPQDQTQSGSKNLPMQDQDQASSLQEEQSSTTGGDRTGLGRSSQQGDENSGMPQRQQDA
jgi:hypothetical protein